MKKVVLIVFCALALCVSASAQRINQWYAGAGVNAQWASWVFSDPGAGISTGFRNYNREALVSFAYGAEAYGYFIPSSTGGGTVFGAYAIPEIGVAIGPRGFKWYPHSGLMAGYASDSNKFGLGWKSGTAFDFGRHVTLDFSAYYTFNSVWTTAVNFIWRF